MEQLVVNYDSDIKKIKIIDSDGKIIYNNIEKDQAVKIAEEQNLDLVKFGEKDDITICKIIDYGKYKYKQEKKQKERKKKQSKNQKIKEINFGLSIAEHDLITKINNAKRILKKGIKVKFGFRLNGKERYIIEKKELEDKLKNILNKYDIEKFADWKDIKIIDHKYILEIYVVLKSV